MIYRGAGSEGARGAMAPPDLAGNRKENRSRNSQPINSGPPRLLDLPPPVNLSFKTENAF